MGWLAPVRSFFFKGVLAIVLRNNPPSEVPTSAEEFKKVNYYDAFLTDRKGGETLFRANKICRFGVSGEWWTGHGEFSAGCSVPNRWLSKYGLHIMHWYKGAVFESNGLLVFIIKYITLYPFLTIRYDRTVQYFFNKKNLYRRDRINILYYLFEKTVKNKNYAARKTDILFDLYTRRWVMRPDKDELMAYYGLLLDSLKNTSDISEDQFGYKICPKAINTITDYQLEERRHSENRAIQKRIGLLTLVLVIIGIVQAASAVAEAWKALSIK